MQELEETPKERKKEQMKMNNEMICTSGENHFVVCSERIRKK